MNNIVVVNVSQQVAPLPATLQKNGAFISQGATILSQGEFSFLSQLSDLTPLLKGSLTLSSLSFASATVTATASAPHGFTVGDTLYLTISGAVPAGYNGTFLCTITTSTAFTYALANNPGTETTPGVYTPEDVAELTQMATTFFAQQGTGQGVFVLELGPGSPTDGVATLTAYITANPNQNYTSGAQGFFYSYLVPRTWDGNAAFLAMLPNYSSPTARTYFYVTTTLTNYSLYHATWKDVRAYIESPQMALYPANVLTALTYNNGVVTATTTTAHNVPVGAWFQIQGCTPTGYNGWWQAQAGTTGTTLVWNIATNPGTETVLGTLEASYVANNGIPNTEFTAASCFWVALNYAPSSTNRVPPNSFAFVFGVTAFPVRGLSSLLSTLNAANVNIVIPASEGGISNTMQVWGRNMDGNSFNYWYAADLAQIDLDLNTANAVINGSNNPLNPLYYNQQGINQLQLVAADTMTDLVTFGLANGQVVMTNYDGPGLAAALGSGSLAGQIVVNAVPFVAYLTANPGDYALGNYAGLSVILIPQLGFQTIVYNLLITTFVTA